MNKQASELTKAAFLELMRFPAQWNEWEMYPDELFQVQRNFYQPGNEVGAEHDRCGAFHWWLKKCPSKDQLRKLVELSYLDQDQLMAEDVRRHIRQAKNFDAELAALVGKMGDALD